MNMKNCSRLNVRKHREIKGSDKYATLDISLKFDCLDKMTITSSESKDNLGRSLVIKAKATPKKCKKSRYAIGNVSKKYLSDIIWEFEWLLYKSYDRKRPKHDCTDSYFYLARHLTNFMVRADALNSHIYSVRT